MIKFNYATTSPQIEYKQKPARKWDTRCNPKHQEGLSNADMRTAVLYNAQKSGVTLDSVCQVSPKDYPFAATLCGLFGINNLESLHKGENLERT